MRLLHCDSKGDICLTQRYDNDHEVPKYAILSHRWEEGQEVDFKDMLTGQGRTKKGWEKLLFCAGQAAQDHLEYWWIDTCCIDKSFPGELQTAISSMFRWYQRAERCYVYLPDVTKSKRPRSSEGDESGSKWEEQFKESVWFKRGWTLQELLAPSSVEFFGRDRRPLGKKYEMRHFISDITGIPTEALDRRRALTSFPEYKRFGWMENRQTEKPEDKVYALLGLFDVDNMAIHYNEGEIEARRRLQEILKERDQIVRNLRNNVSDPSLDKKRIECERGGLLWDSYKWVLDNEEFRQWQHGCDNPLLWIRGDAGRGKTMLVCGIIEQLQETMTTEAIISYFFCQADDARINNAEAVLRGLLFMLTELQPSLLSHFEDWHRRSGENLFGDANSWTALKEGFCNILQDTRMLNTIFIVDGLDECKQGLEKLLPFIAEVSQYPAPVKWLVSSRDWSEIERPLRRIERKLNLRIESNSESVSRAVQAYIEDKVKQLADAERYSDRLKGVVLDHFQSNAEGTFLWVALVYESLRKIPPQHVRHHLNKLPSGLNNIYRTMMDQIHQHSDSFDACRERLAIVSLVFRPLLVEELEDMIEDIPESPLQRRDENIRDCRSFLSCHGQAVLFVHQSAREWILKPPARNIVFPYGCQHEHSRLAKLCIDRLIRPGILKSDIFEFKKPGTRRSEVDPTAFAQLKTGVAYACNYWAEHFISSGESLSDGDYIHKFLQQHLLHWLELLSWLGRLSSAMRYLRELQRIAEGVEVRPFLDEAHRFLIRNRYVIDLAPLQTYRSALIFTPEESSILRTFANCAGREFTLFPRKPRKWTGRIQPLIMPVDDIQKVMFSPDSSLLACLSKEGVVQLWDAYSANIVRRLDWPIENPIKLTKPLRRKAGVIAFSGDSSRVAFASKDGAIRIWSAQSGIRVKELSMGDDRWADAVAFLPDCSTLVTASLGTVQLWDMRTDKPSRQFEVDAPYRGAVTFSINGLFAAVASDQQVQLWNVTTGRESGKLEVDSSKVKKVAFSPDGLFVATVSQRHELHLWNAQSGGKIVKLDASPPGPGYEDEPEWPAPPNPTAVTFSSNSSILAVTYNESCVCLCDLRRCVRAGGLNWIRAIAFSPDGSVLAVISEYQKVYLLDANDFSSGLFFESFATSGPGFQLHPPRVNGIQRSYGPEGEVKIAVQARGQVTVTFSPDGSKLASVDWRSVKLWNPRTGELEKSIPHELDLLSVAFTSNNSILAAAGEKHVQLWNVQSGQVIREVPTFNPRYEQSWQQAPVFSPDGSIAAIFVWGTLWLWHVETGKEIQAIPLRGEIDAMVAVSPNNLVVATLHGHEVNLWEVQTGKKRQHFPVDFKGRCLTVSFSPSSSLIAFAIHKPDEVWLVEVQTGHRKPNIKGLFNDGDSLRHFLTNHENMNMGDRNGILTVRDEWLCIDGEEVCWLPDAWRGQNIASRDNRLAIGHGDCEAAIFECRRGAVPRVIPVNQ